MINRKVITNMVRSTAQIIDAMEWSSQVALAVLEKSRAGKSRK
jgi:hypothetical protein